MDRSTLATLELLDSHILVVDDEPTNVRLLERILADSGYRNVVGITDPRGVEEHLRTFDPDLILLDLLMPKVDGFAVMDLVSERMPEDAYLPILVLTADATPKTKLRALSAGATDFLTKPFDQLEVLLRIRNLLDARMLHGRLREQNEILDQAVTERTRELQQSVDELRKVDRDRRELVERLVYAQEEERGRVAQDIHDDTIQAMTAVGMRLEAIRRRLNGEQEEPIDRLKDVVEGAIDRLRHLLFELRPRILDQEGLAAALRESLIHVDGQRGLDWHLQNELQDEPSAEIRTILFRVAGEAISNVRKHADASRLRVELHNKDGGYLVRVADDGKGLPPGTERNGSLPGHLGLPSMRERVELSGGWISIQSLPGAGTAVEFWLPGRDISTAGPAKAAH
jgi:signal transduction histidine kinase